MSEVKYVGIVPLENESKYQFRMNYVTEKKKASAKQNKAMLIETLKDALAFLEGSETVETGFSGFSRVNVWVEGA